MTNTCIIIPARMNSSRFPGKPLVAIAGIPMIAHCIARAVLTVGSKNVFVATCDLEIAQYANGQGVMAIMTSSEHERATTRVAEAFDTLIKRGFAYRFVIMLQGDEPNILPESVASVISELAVPGAEIANGMIPISHQSQVDDVNNVKVLFDVNSFALYFSRAVIPYGFSFSRAVQASKVQIQTGLIGFTNSSLEKFNELEESFYEQSESVDMNRWIENGGAIRMISMNQSGVGVDTPDDVALAEKLLKVDKTIAFYPKNLLELVTINK